MNKKGFVFVESIVVLVVVALSLAMLLSSYSLVQRKTKEKEFYDKSSDKYLLYAISDLGTSDSCSYSIRCKNGDTVEDSINFRADVDDKDKNGLDNPYYCKNQKLGRILYSCDEVLKSMQIRSVYVVKDVSSALKSSNATSVYDNGVIEYMKSLKKCDDENVTGTAARSSTCDYPIAYMIGVFERGNNDLYYASINLSGNVDKEARPRPETIDTIDPTNNRFTITFEPVHGSPCDPSTKLVTYDDTYGYLCETERLGHEFKGWYLEPEYIYRVDSETIVKTAKPHSLYAKWEPNSFYVEYDSTGGSQCTPSTKLVTYDQPYGSLCTPSKEGYQFAGWYKDTSYNEAVKAETRVNTNMGHKLYAKWTPNVYTIKFNGNGYTSGSTASVTCYYNSDCTLTANGFKKTGSLFDGWSYNGSVYDDKKVVKNLTSTHNAELTFTARWKAADPFVFAYNGAFKVTDGSNTNSYAAVSSGTTNITIKNTNWSIELYTPGTLTIISATSNIDVFAAGGGGGGSGTGCSNDNCQTGGGGGAGGYTDYKTNIEVPNGTNNYTVSIGSGGAAGEVNANGGAGGKSSITIGSVTVSANGGSGGNKNGTDQTGGTGKGGGLGKNGGDGICPFNNCTYNSYKYGGGGGGGAVNDCGTINGGWCSRPTNEGAGGASGGASASHGNEGPGAHDNTAGGGAAGCPGEKSNDGHRPRKGGKGGSGIIIIRNKR